MSDSKNTAIPPLLSVIRYLSRDSLQSLQLTPQEIVASIEHLILGRTGSKPGMRPKWSLRRQTAGI